MRRPTGVPGRLVVRRIPDFNAEKKAAAGHCTLFDVWRFHGFVTTADPDLLDTGGADKTHRGHAIIEQVHADLKGSALAHLPSGVSTANAAWLVLAVMAFNPTRTAAALSDTDLRCATTATIRRKPITVPARVATSVRRVTLHLPLAWPGKTQGPNCSTGSPSHQKRSPPDRPAQAARPETMWNPPAARPGTQPRPSASQFSLPGHPASAVVRRWIEATGPGQMCASMVRDVAKRS
jgi:hypothetical protein